jgi:hypothetical protein
MNTPSTPSSTPSSAPALPRALSRGQLTAALVLITLLPFCLVVVLYVTLPDFRDPVLQVEASIGPRAWPDERSPDARIVPSLILKNPTSDAWRYVNLSINEQFHFTHPDELKPGEEIFIPLKFFHTKGNQFFPPESQELKLLTVYAQIPSGARAIVEIPGTQLLDSPRGPQLD